MTKQVFFELKTKYHFGPNVVLDHLSKEISNLKVKNVLLLYGFGSIKKNGLYQAIVHSCKKSKVKLFEFSNIEPNPRDQTIYKAAQFASKNKIDLIIAAGGGSVIDASKVVAILAKNPQYKSVKEYVKNQTKVKALAIPIFAIVTLAATGSENNNGSVITLSETNEKVPVFTPSACPTFAFEDPNYTFSLSWWQTACGIFDIFSHLLEQFYDVNQFEWTKNYILSQVRTLIDNAKILKHNPNDYDARANILWTSSFALNGLCKFNNNGGDWAVHKLEHAISGLWDVEHGAGLALLTPAYIEYMASQSELFRQHSLEIARVIFHVSSIKKYLKKLKEFIKFLNLPEKYTDFQQIKSVSDTDIQFLVNHFYKWSNHKDNLLAKKIYSKLVK